MKRNPGHLPAAAVGKRVRVQLTGGISSPASGWPADGRGGVRWSRTGSPFDFEFYEVIA